MGEEGTAEIVHKDSSGYFYVTFHGWDPAAVKSGRGVAKTRDFVTWVTDDGGLALPNDSIFSSTDCDKWNIDWAKGGCVGGGEGTMMRSGDYWYHIIEAPDVSLGCLQDQNWVRGDGALDVSLVASLVVSCRLLSSHLISSHLISSHLISSRLVSLADLHLGVSAVWLRRCWVCCVRQPSHGRLASGSSSWCRRSSCPW
jgi:hypothetical protein